MKTVQDVYDIENRLRKFIKRVLDVFCGVDIHHINRENNTCKCDLYFYKYLQTDTQLIELCDRLKSMLIKTGITIIDETTNGICCELPVKESDIENLFTVFKMQDNFQ